MTDLPAWLLQGFIARLDAWVDAAQPLDELRVLVTDWVFTRMSDPFANARRVQGFEDYWQAVIPGSDHFDGYAERCGVVCLYWLDVSSRTVVCDRIASLSLPLV